MPRVYISDPRGKEYRKRNESDLNAAAAEVKNGISLRKAAENHTEICYIIFKFSLHYVKM